MMKTRINPKTGKAETVDEWVADPKEKLERTRRELRDMLAGNTRFHKDQFAAPPPPPQPPAEEFDPNGYINDYVNRDADFCWPSDGLRDAVGKLGTHVSLWRWRT